MSPEDAARQLEVARCLFREANDAVFLFEPEGLRVVDVNPAALRLTGLDRREALALRLIDLIAADVPADLDRLLEANRRTTFFHSREGYSLARPGHGDGLGRVPVNVSVSRVHVEPTPLGMAVVRDVGDQRRAREVLDRFFDLSPTAFAVFDRDGRFHRANLAWRAILGHDPAGLTGTDPLDLVHPDDLEATRAAGRSLPDPGVSAFENRLRHRDGSYRRLSWNAAMADGLTYAVAADVTERERAREADRARRAADEASRAKDRFLAVLSHELRTPLNPILLAVTAMIDGATPPEAFPDALEMIRRNVELEARLIDDLLDVTRIVQGKLRLLPRAVDVHAALAQSVEAVRGEREAKAIGLDLALGARRHRAEADASRLQQVFRNLVGNAVKFTPRGGSIAIRTRDEPAGLVVEVADTGIGIDPDALPGLFRPFQQGEAGITRRFGGLGLGLAISRGIVEAHGGTIEAESAGPGLGSTFRLTLPSLPESAPASPVPSARATPEPTEPGQAGEPGPLSILLVEDEPATRRIMAELLRSLGHSVVPAGTLAEATRRAEAGPFDLIVSDLGLPDGSGHDLLPRVTSPPPAIAVSGFGMPEDIQRSLAAGFSAHLIKPIGLRDLAAAIRRVTA